MAGEDDLLAETKKYHDLSFLWVYTLGRCREGGNFTSADVACHLPRHSTGEVACHYVSLYINSHAQQGILSVNRGGGWSTIVRGEEVDLGEHIYLGGGGLREAANGTRLISSTSCVSSNNQQCGIWTWMPRMTRGCSELYHL